MIIYNIDLDAKYEEIVEALILQNFKEEEQVNLRKIIQHRFKTGPRNQAK